MRTALHAAAVKGHVLAVHVLVQAGAQLDPQDSDLLTPAMLAALHGHVRIVQYLVKAGACVTHQVIVILLLFLFLKNLCFIL